MFAARMVFRASMCCMTIATQNKQDILFGRVNRINLELVIALLKKITRV